MKFRLPGTMEARSLRGCIETTRIARSWMPTSKHVRFAEANLSICGFCGQHLEHTRALPIPPFVEPEPVFIAARNMQPAESPPAEEALRIDIQSVLASTRNHRGGDGGCDSHFDIFCSLFRVQAPWRTSCNRTQMVHLSCWRRQPTQVRSSERRRPYYRPKNHSASFGLRAPVGTFIEDLRPTFRWQPLPGTTEYQVKVFDPNLDQVEASPAVHDTFWTSSHPLIRGRRYLWQVTTVRNVQRLVSPAPPFPEAKFSLTQRKYPHLRHSSATTLHHTMSLAWHTLARECLTRLNRS